MKTFAVLILTILLPMLASANIIAEFSGTYLTENLGSTDVKENSSKYFYNVAGYLTVKKKLYAGWSYLGISMTGKSDASGSDQNSSYVTADTGPVIKYYLDKRQIYSVTAAYNILSRATFKNVVSDDSESWTGTSFWVAFGLMPEIKNGLHIGVSINYYSASYTKKTVDGTETSESNTKSWLFPSLTISKEW
ncbi:hypothetical protein [Bdellovibrio sp. GT3]|uniref:hypothetical protein n=1 Tax=Bdellovibrio sp. GT3 TaxID=3136282 RepID=UPI0030F1CC62